MVNGPSTSYQPTVAYQGGQINTPQQEVKSGETQPKQAPAADTQRGDQRTRDDNGPPASADRGSNLDVKA